MTSITCLLQLVAIAASPVVGQDADAPAPASAVPVTVIEEAPDPEYNLEVPLSFAGELAEAEIIVRFDETEAGDRLELRVTTAGTTVVSVGPEGEEPISETLPITVGEDGAALVTLRRRAEKISLLDRQRCVATLWRPSTAGKLSIAGPEGAFVLDDVYYQPYAVPEFADDFMRDETDSTGEWQVLTGTFENTALVDSLKFVPKASNSFAFAAHADPFAMAVAGFPFWDELQCGVSIRLIEPGRAGLAFRAVDAENYYSLTLEFGHAQDPEHGILTLRKVVAGEEEILGSDARGIPMGQWYRLEVADADGLIQASLDGAPVFEVADDTLSQGSIGLVASHCPTAYFDDAQASEYLSLCDDFEAYGHSRWHPVKGEWLAVTDPKGGNAAISPASKDEALTIAGKATWTDYLIEVDARPSKGPAGVCFLFTSPTDYWLWRFLPGASRQELVRVTDAGETIVDEARLALPDKGYTGVAIRVGSDFIRVSIPGADDLDALLPAGGAGKIGFWAGPGSKAEFDNVSVTFPPGYVAPAIPDTMAADAEMSQQFMNPAEGWFSVTDEAHRPQAVGMNWNKGEYFDPVDITFPMANVVAAAGRVTVTIEGDQTGTGGGYQLVLSTEENSPALDLTLSSRDQVLKQVQAQVADTGECAVRYGRRGSYIIAYIDDQLILSYREQPEGAEVANSDDAQGSTQP